MGRTLGEESVRSRICATLAVESVDEALPTDAVRVEITVSKFLEAGEAQRQRQALVDVLRCEREPCSSTNSDLSTVIT